MDNVLVCGVGNMGGVLCNALIQVDVAEKNLTLLERFDTDAVETLTAKGCPRIIDPADLTGEFDLVVLAVKPQDAPEVMAALKDKIGDAAVLSVMAGVTTETIEKALGRRPVIRVMPNTPALIGKGMSVFYPNEEAHGIYFDFAFVLLDQMGMTIHVKEEDMIDAATAISGSGPAYLFYLAEQLAESAEDMGFTEIEAKKLSNQTLFGAAALLINSKETAAELRAKVTSKGGTTFAALETFKEKGVDKGLKSGFLAALKRAEELGGH